MLVLLLAAGSFIRLGPPNSQLIRTPHCPVAVRLSYAGEPPYSCETDLPPQPPQPQQKPPNLSPFAQLGLILPLYALYICTLSQISLGKLFGRFCPAILADEGVENLMGAAILVCSAPLRVRLRSWKLPQRPPWATVRTGKTTLAETLGALVAAYLLSGYVGSISELLMSAATGLGATGLTEARRSAVQVRVVRERGHTAGARYTPVNCTR